MKCMIPMGLALVVLCSGAYGLDYGEGLFYSKDEMINVKGDGPDMAPTEQSKDVKARYYSRLIGPATYEGESKRFRLMIEPRSKTHAAVTVSPNGTNTQARSGVALLSCQGEATRMALSGDQKKRVPGEKTFEDILRSEEGWQSEPLSRPTTLGYADKWVFRTFFETEAKGPLTLVLVNQARFIGRISVLVNGKPVPQNCGWRVSRMIPVEWLRQGRNELAFCLEALAPEDMGKQPMNAGVSCYLVNTDGGAAIESCSSGKLSSFDTVRLWPLTSIFVLEEGAAVDRVVWRATDNVRESSIQFSALLAPTGRHGFCKPRGADFVFEDGTKARFIGGHINRPPSYEDTERLVEACRNIGSNVIRIIPLARLMLDMKTATIDPAQLDMLHYMVYRLGQAGIYTHLTLLDYHRYALCDPGGLPDKCYEQLFDSKTMKKMPKMVSRLAQMTEPKMVQLEKDYIANLLTARNPYTGKTLLEDPALQGIEFSTEIGLGGRSFDWNDYSDPVAFGYRMKLWNKYLLAKYGPSNGKYFTDYSLYKQWAGTPIFKWEVPDVGGARWPERFNGNRLYPQMDGVNSVWYLDAEKRIADPRISDAMECMSLIQKNWIDTHAAHLKEMGVRAGISWSGDNFNVYQVGARWAGVESMTMTEGCLIQDARDDFGGLGGWDHMRRNFYVYNKPTFGRWYGWWNCSHWPWEMYVLGAVLGRVYGYDGLALHKYQPVMLYPASDTKTCRDSISPFVDKRRGAMALASWIMQKSRIKERDDKIIIAFPKDDVLYGGANVPMKNSLCTGWLEDYLQCEEYYFDMVYDGPDDRIVFHDGRAPVGDYRKAKHAILWSHGSSDRFAHDHNAKEKWFKLHGLEFKNDKKYVLTDKYLAVRGDVNADPDFAEMLYKALQKWHYPLPYAFEEIGKCWRNLERNIEIDFAGNYMKADRTDLQVWMGHFGDKKQIKLAYMEINSPEDRMDAALIPFDTANFSNAEKLLFWCPWDATITIRLPFGKKTEVYAVNWLGARLYRVGPQHRDEISLVISTIRDDDIFFYEIVK